MRPNRKLFFLVTIAGAMIVAQSFAQREQHDDPPPKNLQVLPKNMTGEEVHKIMREYALSLGVRCGFCHQAKEGGDRPRLDFVSDARQEKIIARGMIRMVDSVNHMLDIMGNNNLEHITCVTCHRGNAKPMVSIDSLRKERQ